MRRKPSRLIWFAAIATVSVGALRMDAQDSQQGMRRFRLGQQVGDCLLKGCSALVATIESISPPEKEPTEPDPERAVMFRKLQVAVRERLHGSEDRNSIQVLAATRPRFSKTNQGPWNAWEGVTLGVGAHLLLLRWPNDASRPEWHGLPEDVALAVSDPELQVPIREAIAQHHRFEREPNEIAKVPQLFRERQDPLFRGYLVTYVMKGASVTNVDQAATLVTGLLAEAALPEAGRDAITDWLGGTFYRLEDPVRKTTAEALVASAASDVGSIAGAALRVLIKLSELQLLDVKPLLTPARQQKIVANYRAFQARTKAPEPHPAFEAQLGVR